MNRENTSLSKTLPLVSKPPTESFFDQEHTQAVWPQRIVARRDFARQIHDQRTLVRTVQAVFTALPVDTTIESGLAADLVSETEVCNFFTALSEYLHTDSSYQRLVLYFPLEFTAPVYNKSVALTQASNRFQKAYRTAWEAQLLQHEVRANYVDGDVLEFELREADLPRVVKATHLIPGLIRSGHMGFAEVVAYVADTADVLMHSGVLDACEVLLDMQLITADELSELSAYLDDCLHDRCSTLLQRERSVLQSEKYSVQEVLTELSQAIAVVTAINPPGDTPNRIKWLREAATEKAISVAAKQLCVSLKHEEQLPNVHTLDGAALRACIDAIRLHALQVQTLAQKHEVWLDAVVKHTADQSVTDTTKKLYLHLFAKGIIDAAVLKEHNMHFPFLQGPFSKNLDSFTPSVDAFEDMTTQIAEDAYLSTRVYPVAILLGSQLKGYGISNADADVAVFIRAGVSMTDLPELAERLKKIFVHERIGGSAIMFWLEESRNSLVIRENTQTTGALPLPTWTHVLMGGAWVGAAADITALQHDLLTPYLFNPTEVFDGKPIRERWLEEIERDSILYRLLHKGYGRYYPVQSPMDTPHGVSIDGATAFYDPQFRRIATQLFLTRVFFPNLG